MIGLFQDPAFMQKVSTMSANGKLLEMLMLICFGMSWPISIIKTLRSKSVQGVSAVFYSFIFVGYLSGAMYKLFFNYDVVIYFYIVNAVMVFIQIVLFTYYSSQHKLTCTKTAETKTPEDSISFLTSGEILVAAVPDECS